MASSNGAREERSNQSGDPTKTLKEGERLLAPSRRPDGTLRKPIRIRAGYVPQDEVAIYQSKAALLKKEQASQAGPPGYDPSLDAKPKSKSVKRNERKKEKRLQAAMEKNLVRTGGEGTSNQEALPDENSETIASLTSQLNILDVSRESSAVAAREAEADSEEEFEKRIQALRNKLKELSISEDSSTVTPALDTAEGSEPVGNQDRDKRIRALKKKIRLADGLLQKSAKALRPAQLERISKLGDWRRELKLLEDNKS